jgi:hypothetical protein
MSSSISISERGRWRRVLGCYAALCPLLAILIGVTLVVLDPYDTGRLSLFGGHGVPAFGQRLTAASVAREPAVEAALIGASTIQLIDPAALTALTALHFVSLAIPGTGPAEQLAVADWLARRHRGAEGKPLKAVVFGLDASWCRADGRLELLNPFPFWLYSDSMLDYVTSLVHLKTFDAAARKIKLLVGLEVPLAPDGYRDYEVGRTWTAEAASRQLAGPRYDPPVPEIIEFAAVPRLQRFLPELPASVRVVLIFLPRHHSGLPAPGSPADRLERLCKQGFRTLAATRPRTLVIDLAVDGDLARDDQGYWDPLHYRKRVANQVERVIAEGLAGLDRE